MKHYTLAKPQHGSSEWLAIRWRDHNGLARISASNAAAVHGQHPYLSGAQLAVELLRDEPPVPQEQNRAMLRGNTLEEPIRGWAAQLLSKSLHTPDTMFAYEEDGVRLIATLDAMDEDGEVYEIKTKRGRWTGELPDMWYWQGIQQAICADVDSITWVIFDSDLDIQFHKQVVTSDEKRVHIERCRQYLAAIDMGMVPDDASMTYRDVSDLYPNSNKTSVELGSDVAKLVHEYNERTSVMSMHEDRLGKIKTEICELLGNSESGTIDNEVVVTWKTATRTSIDTKRFEAEHPALAAKYKKQSTYRTFRVVDKQGERE